MSNILERLSQSDPEEEARQARLQQIVADIAAKVAAAYKRRAAANERSLRPVSEAILNQASAGADFRLNREGYQTVSLKIPANNPDNQMDPDIAAQALHHIQSELGAGDLRQGVYTIRRVPDGELYLEKAEFDLASRQQTIEATRRQLYGADAQASAQILRQAQEESEQEWRRQEEARRQRQFDASDVDINELYSLVQDAMPLGVE